MKSLYFSTSGHFGSVDPLPFIDFELAHISGKLSDKPESKQVYEKFDAVICPGNSFGHMTGGFDQGVVDVFGISVQTKVREMIERDFFGMMPVGASSVIEHDGRVFVYTPTMMVPVRFTDIALPYMCMYNSLVAIHQYEKRVGREIERVLCPLFAAGTGGADPMVAYNQQKTALVEVLRGIRGGSNMCNDLFKDGTDRYLRLSRV